MSSIRVVKGYPKSLLIRLKTDGVETNLNDGTWTVVTELRFQTKTGAKPFEITPVVSGLNVTISLTSVQTSQLSHVSTGYVLVVKASKTDESAFIESVVPVSVTNGL